MFKRAFILRKLNETHSPSVTRIFAAIQAVCQNPPVRKHPITLITAPSEIDNTTLVIAIGGDGTMLEAMRLAHDAGAAVTGVHIGNVGFLTDFATNTPNLVHQLYDAVYEKSPIEDRVALQCSLQDKAGLQAPLEIKAFNEFVISNKFSDQLIKYTLFIGDRCAGVHRANALIVGTPTGSTAYSLSAGGGLLLPSMAAMQIVPVAPIGLTSRPIIVPSSEDIRVGIETQGEWTLKADGGPTRGFEYIQHIDTQLVITDTGKPVRVLHSPDWSYFDMLTKKLGWNARN